MKNSNDMDMKCFFAKTRQELIMINSTILYLQGVKAELEECLADEERQGEF
jgi:hypothetical protein